MKTKLGCLLQKYVLAMICLLFAPMTHAATPYAKGALLQIVSQMPEGTWQKVNVNSYSEAWTPAALRPLYGFGNPTPHKIIEAWSSFAWDSNRGDLILYGGGHANYSGNDVYRWRSRDLRWERASLPSEIELVPDSSAAYQAIDGAQNAPASAHTYDNAVFLPRSDRYLNFGGAVFNSGSFYAIRDGDPLATRRTGPYLFDPSKADPNKVGGTTGSHVQRVEPFPEIEGGRMWENRDIPKHLAGQPIPTSHVNGCTAYSPESDYDIVYVAARIGGGTGLYLYRYQITDINAPWLDQIERVGDYWSAPATQTSCGYDPASKVFLRLGNNSNPFYFWDLRPERQTNRDRAVATTGSVAEFVEWINSFTNSTGISLRQCSLDFDPNRGNFLLWCGSAEVWRISPPEQLSTSGWQVWREELGPGESPPLNVGIGILGKWKYVPGFDVFIGLENVVNGNIWVYKPIGWVPPETEDTGDGSNPEPDPDPVNQPPTVVLNSPATGETVAVNSLVTLSAQASDGDGTVMEVAFYVNGSAIGSATTEPYLADWIATEPGEYVLTAVAIDNMGASTTSEPVILTVQSDTSPPPDGDVMTTVIYRDSNLNEQAVADTHLSTYHRNHNFGSAQNMLFLVHNYTPLIRFNVFASEGGPVPDNAIIEAAELHLYKSEYSNVVALHAMMKPWKEHEATWFRASNDLFWDTPGAAGAGSDYHATADATLNMNWNAGWVSFNISERLKAFAEGEPNYGWRLLYISGNIHGLVRFGASEQEMDIRPKLEIKWRMNNSGDNSDSGPEPDPDPVNQPPTVVLNSPATGETVAVNSLVTLSAQASDSDGTVTEVIFYVNGSAIGSATTEPYLVDWIASEPGEYVLTAAAIDNMGASTTSEPVILTVQSDTSPPPDGDVMTTVIYRDSNLNEQAVADTHLSTYHRNHNFGSAQNMLFLVHNYTPLIRFNVFASEGGPVPDNAIIEAAELHLYKSEYSNVVALHAMMKPWKEHEATWRRASNGLFWDTPGAAGAGSDYHATADAVLNMNWNAGWVSFNVSERLKAFAEGEPNYGWRLLYISGNIHGLVRFGASEQEMDIRPKLEIKWRM